MSYENDIGKKYVFSWARPNSQVRVITLSDGIVITKIDGIVVRAKR